MNQERKKGVSQDGQFLYMGRWVEKAGFRAFVYGCFGNQKLAKSYEEFVDLTSSGAWFESIDQVPASKVKEKRNVITLSNGK